jgi:peptidoglycan/LPS O-acetylase OafA/YrhL
VDKKTRFASLQGLRGIAAATVVVSHALGIFYISGADAGTVLESIRAVSHLSGILAAKAVWIFFVLSGFVLTHQLESRSSSAVRFVGARLIRLYFPVWFAIALNFGVIALIHSSGREIGFWIGGDPDLITPVNVVEEFLLLPEGYFLGPLWSLKWEVAFSLLVVLFWRVNLLKRFPLATIFVSLCVATYGELIQNGWLKYLPMFVIGMALHTLILGRWESEVSGRMEIVVLFVTLSLPTISYLITSETFLGVEYRYVLDVPISLVAISILFVAIIRGRFVRKLLEIKPLQNLGDFSYSLYLFHLPLISFAFYFSNASVMWVLLAFGLSFPIAYICYRLIEVPSHRLSKKIRGSSDPSLKSQSETPA